MAHMTLTESELNLFRSHLDCQSEWPYTCCTDYGDFEIDILDKLQVAVQYNHFDLEELIMGDGWNDTINLYEIALDYVDNYDPTPWCAVCGAMKRNQCSCP